MTVDLHVLPEGRRVGVALAATRVAALVRFVHEVGPCVLESVRGIRVGLAASRDGADVRLFSCVRACMDPQVFLSAEAFVTLAAHVRPFVRVGTDVDQHLVSSVEALGSGASVPQAEKGTMLGRHVSSC